MGERAISSFPFAKSEKEAQENLQLALAALIEEDNSISDKLSDWKTRETGEDSEAGE